MGDWNHELMKVQKLLFGILNGVGSRQSIYHSTINENVGISVPIEESPYLLDIHVWK